MRFLVFAALIATQSATAAAIGDIEFFGYKGFDIATTRKALPLHEGDVYSQKAKDSIRQSVLQTIGTAPTDVAAICCDENGDRLIFIGLPGGSYKSFAYNPEPKGDGRLPPKVMNLYQRLDRAMEEAVQRGGDAIHENDSYGYALISDPAARALQLQVREWAVGHEQELVRVLDSSSAVEHRRVASDALGYGRQSRAQVLALSRAARDPDDEVRNNATRALGVLVRWNRKLANQISSDTFIEMLNSGVWSDRNKAAALLDGLTATRNPELLAKIRSTALDSLIEMASWRGASHAFFARELLGRVAGIPEKQLTDLAWNGPVETIVQAARQPALK